MTLRTRHVVVVSGLVILVLWALATLDGIDRSGPRPEPRAISDGLDRVWSGHVRPE